MFVLFLKFECYISEANSSLAERCLLLRSKADSAPALILIHLLCGTMAHRTAPSLQPGDKSLIEFLNAKGLDVKYPTLTACPEEIDTAFQDCSQLNASFYANGYEFFKE